MINNQRFSYLLLIILICGIVSSQAQQRNCSTMDVLEQRLQSDPDLAAEMQNIESFTQRIIQKPRKSGIITIPVVIHVIYQTAAQNISNAQILSQMEVLQEDFRRTNANADNAWPQAADTEIEFCLASVDPNGNPTTGITRKYYNRAAWGFDDEMMSSANGGVDAWPVSDYLNIWVCNLGNDYLGYAQFPGGDPSTDGVVMSPQYFGRVGTAEAPFDLGRTATHEIGHWLNLRHIWGDGNCNADDFVNDTPLSDRANYGCNIGHVSCNSTDMVQNYMDYSEDYCMNLFTQGQKDRMRAMFDTGGFRASLLNSPGCGPIASCDDGIQNQGETGVDCGGPCDACSSNCSGTEVTFSITFDNYPEDVNWTITNSAGTIVAFGDNYGNQADESTLAVTQCLSNGCYDFTINDAYGDGICCSYGSGSYSVTGGSNTLASGGSFASSQTTNFCLNTQTPTCNDGIQNQDETDVDCGGPCAPCNNNCSDTEVTFSITFDDYPQDTSWEITNSSGAIVASGDNYDNQPDGSTLTVAECLPNGCYNFTINDDYGDGICCSQGNGSYSVTGGGSTLVSGNSFGDSETSNFCLGTQTTPTCNDGIQNQGETGIDCGGPCTPCTNNCSGTEIIFSITFDDYPQETSWEITNSSGTIVASGDDYDNQPDGSTLAIKECLSSGCYDFIIKDSYGDGICCGSGNGSYSVTGGGNTLVSGSSFGDSETSNFCLGASSTPTCNDDIQNQGETGIDCGGPCTPCNSNCSGTEVTFSITFDDYPQDTSWEITNSSNVTVASGDNYDNQADGSTLTVKECLPNGCYDFTINDVYGDGICCKYGNGTYSLTGGGNTLASGSSFGDSETTNFCLNKNNCTTRVIDFENFESGWGIWNGGGSDSYRNKLATYASSGSYSIRLRDNTTSSTVTTDNINLEGQEELTVEFSYFPIGMDDNEVFLLQVSTNGGSSYSTAKTWTKGTDFENNTPYNESVTIVETFTTTTKIRLKVFASTDEDRVYFDDISLIACIPINNILPRKKGEPIIGFDAENQESYSLSNDLESGTVNDIQVYPNPATNQVKVELNLTSFDTNTNLYIVDVSGKMVYRQTVEPLNQKKVLDINVESLPTGVYIINVVSDQQQFTKKLTVLD